MSKILHMRVDDDVADYVNEVARESGMTAAKAAGHLLRHCETAGIRFLSVRTEVKVTAHKDAPGD